VKERRVGECEVFEAKAGGDLIVEDAVSCCGEDAEEEDFGFLRRPEVYQEEIRKSKFEKDAGKSADAQNVGPRKSTGPAGQGTAVIGRIIGLPLKGFQWWTRESVARMGFSMRR